MRIVDGIELDDGVDEPSLEYDEEINEPQDCPYCDNSGILESEGQELCQWCFSNPDSKFNES